MNRLISLFVLFFLCLTPPCSSQNWAWATEGKGGNIAAGSPGDKMHNVCHDTQGNVYICGSYSSSITFGSFTLTTNNSPGFYLVKYDANGNIQWAQSSAGAGVIHAMGISCDVNDNVCLTGTFAQTVIIGTATLSVTNNLSAMFIARFNPSGNLQWAKTFGQDADSKICNSIMVDNQNNYFIAGSFTADNLTLGNDVLTNYHQWSAFVAKLDTGGIFIWARGSGTKGYNLTRAACTDLFGNVYIAGYHMGFDISFGTFTLTNAGQQDAFLAKYDPTGNVVWAKNFGTSSHEDIYTVSANYLGDIFVGGSSTHGSFQAGTYTITNPSPGEENLFILKLDQNGNVLTPFNASGKLSKANVIRTAGNDVYVSGEFYNSLVLNSTTLTATTPTNHPRFLAVFDQGGILSYAVSLNTGGLRCSMSVDNDCNAYLAGFYRGDSTDMVVGSMTLSSSGEFNPYLAKHTFACTVGMNDQPATTGGMIIAPNPSQGLFKLYGEFGRNAVLNVYNSLGQRLSSKDLCDTDRLINLKNYGQGIYYAEVIETNGSKTIGKLIVE